MAPPRSLYWKHFKFLQVSNRQKLDDGSDIQKTHATLRLEKSRRFKLFEDINKPSNAESQSCFSVGEFCFPRVGSV